jgi:hypothetical protein
MNSEMSVRIAVVVFGCHLVVRHRRLHLDYERVLRERDMRKRSTSDFEYRLEFLDEWSLGYLRRMRFISLLRENFHAWSWRCIYGDPGRKCVSDDETLS